MADNSGNRLTADAEDSDKQQENNKDQHNLEKAPVEAVNDANYSVEHESVTSNLSSNPSVFEQQPPQLQPMMIPPHPGMMSYTTYSMDPNFPHVMMPALYAPPPPPPPSDDPSTMVAFYSAQMKDHAAAYANAAAGAAWAAAQVASQAAEYARAQGVPDHQLMANTPSTNYHRRGTIRRRIIRSDNDSNSSGSSNYKINNSRKKKARSDQTLLGKTAVSALYEYCNKRGKTPTFTTTKMGREFHATVTFDNKEMGQGTGCNKGMAKQMAAKMALQSVFPGVKLDSETGLVVCIENYNLSMHKLAISSDNHSSSRPKISKRGRGLLAEHSTTTSEGEEDDEYFSSSRRNSQCSVLLHKIVQVDTIRLPDIPTFCYELTSVKRTKADDEDGSSAILPSKHQSGGLFRCTGMLRIVQPNNGSDTIMTAVGVGGRKRESKHKAAANLLAALFPEASTEEEVRAAAEQYIEQCTTAKRVSSGRRRNSDFPFALSQANDPALPRSIRDELRGMLSNKRTAEDDLVSSVNAVALSDTRSSTFQKLSRKRQVDNMVESALQKLNDRDEEGRSLPEELTANDVGRTILRRAEPGDLLWIRRLFSSTKSDDKDRQTDAVLSSTTFTGHTGSEPSSLWYSNPEISGLVSQLWSSSSSVVLLLCRAIAAYEDPPLGCAILTFGFSMDRGRVLRLARISSEPHLPQERFLECLEGFSSSLGCDLEGQPGAAGLSISLSDAASIVESYLLVPTTRSKLQSVQEETEEDDVSSGSVERPGPTKRRSTQPSKRSRVE